jgi:hypothetical protein
VRYLVCLIAGLVMGAVLASIVIDATSQRHAWPRGVMNVLQHDLAEARAATRAGGNCSAPSQDAARTRMQAMAGDLDHALLAPGAKDRVLSRYAEDLRRTLVRWEPHAACATQATSLADIANACDACHRDYR